MRYDVVVIGGGVVGLSTAWALVRAGLPKVALLERRTPGAGASGVGAGSLSLARWVASDIAMVQRSLELMTSLQKASGGFFRVQTTGRLTLAGPGEQATALEELADIVRSAGQKAEQLTPGLAADRYPSINFEDAAAVLYNPDDAMTHPPLLVSALWSACRSVGVHVLEGTEATGIRLKGQAVTGVTLAGGHTLDTDEVVVAAGIQSRRILLGTELDAPLKPYRTQAAFMLLPGLSTHPVVYDSITGMYTVPRNPGSTLAGDGTAAHEGDPDQFERGIDPEFRASILKRFRHRFPSLDKAVVTGGWAGICDMTPDGRPLIGPYAGIKGLYLNCGFAGFGVMRSLAAGEALGYQIAGKSPMMDLDLCAADRYNGWQDFELNFGRPYDPLGH